jgi:hypothetical protein
MRKGSVKARGLNLKKNDKITVNNLTQINQNKLARKSSYGKKKFISKNAKINSLKSMIAWETAVIC